MRKTLFALLVVFAALSVSGCARQVGTVVGTAVHAVHHPVAAVQRIGTYRPY